MASVRSTYGSLALASLAVCCGQAAHAVDLAVPTQFTSVQAAINAASSGDTILVAPGTYPEQLQVGGKTLIIRGTGSTPDDVRLIGNNQGPIVLLSNAANVTFDRVAIRGGRGGNQETCGSLGLSIYAGAVLSKSSTVEFDRVLFTDNTAALGGTIFLEGGNLTIRRSEFRDNGIIPPASGQNVGAVLRTCNRGAPANILIEDSVFTGNGDPSGAQDVMSPFNSPIVIRRSRFENNRGAVLQPLGITDVTVEDCQFLNNSGNRGAITVAGAELAAAVTIRRSRFENNSASNASDLFVTLPEGPSTLVVTDTKFINAQDGGSFFLYQNVGNDAVIERCEFRGGTSPAFAYVGNASTASIRNSLFANIAGEALLINIPSDPATISIDNCTIADNAATGIRTDALLAGTLNVRNSIVTGNTGTQIGAPIISLAGVINVSYSIVQGGYAGAGNINALPRFVSPGSVTGDYRLQATSPAIDAGDSSIATPLAGEPAALDLTGLARRVNAPAVADTGVGPAPVVDIGAFEFQNPATCRADFNGAGGVTVQDVFDFLTAWFAGAPGADFNGAGGITVQDVFDFLTAWFAGCP